MKSAGPASLTEGLQRARQALEAQRFDEARRVGLALLEAHAGSADVLALLGETDYRRGEPAAARSSLDKALALSPRHARSQWVLGNLHQDEGKLDRAIALYRRALRADESLTEAHNDLGTAYFAKGWHQEAEQCYRAALALQPRNLPATENLAATLRAQGKWREARNAFFQALRLRVAVRLRRIFGFGQPAAPSERSQDAARSELLAAAKRLLAGRRWTEAEEALAKWVADHAEDAEALHFLGAALLGSGKHAQAVSALERAIGLRSSSPDFRVTLGNALAARREHVKAIESYQAAYLLDPGNAQAAAGIARALHELGHFREAEEIHRLGLELEPDADMHSNLAASLLALGRFAEAEAAARKSLGMNPGSVHALITLSSALMQQGRIEEAQATVESAEAMDPDNVLVLRWKALFQMTRESDFPAAEATLRRAESISPQDYNVHVDLARCLLTQQRFAAGWDEYEWRKRAPARAYVYSRLPYPEWDGTALPGKSIVVNGEQGLGDEIMFASCLGELAGQARRSVLYCNTRLESLFRRSFPGVQIVAGSENAGQGQSPVLEDIDLQVAAGSLPRVFRRRPEDFPRHSGYLKPDDARMAKWRGELAGLGPKVKVGISWKGGTPLSEGARRTLSLEELDPLLRVPGIAWVSLQYGDSSAERSAWKARGGAPLHHWQGAVDDLEETAALIAALDFCISVCNTQVHIAGALGKEVWVLTPLAPDWRYGNAGEGMLWYPAARMFRQDLDRDWSKVIGRVAAELSRRVRSGDESG